MAGDADMSSSVLSLRDYQRAALDAVHAARAKGVTRQLISLPTGSGKTFVAAHLVSEIGLPTVFMVHRDELVTQTLRQMHMVNPALSLGVCKADRNELHRDIVVASAQTLAHAKRLAMLRAAVGGGGLFISDESHHDLAPTRTRAINEMEPALLVGLTATPMRGDKQGLDAIYDEIVYHLPMLDLIARGQLARLVGLRIDTETELDAVHTRAGEFAEDELTAAVDTPQRNQLIVESWQKHARDRTRTVAFCVTRQHAKDLRDCFRAAGIQAEMVLGETPPEERARIFADFHAGRLPVLTNCTVLTEGYDEPAIDCILMARPTKSPGLFIQAVGRGARKSPGKPNCLVVDFVDATSKHKLIGFPSLLGEEVSAARAPGVAGEPEPLIQGELVDLLEMAQKRGRVRERAAVFVDLFAASPFIWRDTGGRFMAPAGKDAWLTLEEVEGGFVPVRIEAVRDSLPVVTRLFARPVDSETAMALAEARIEQNQLTARSAGWRSRPEPATEGQHRAARYYRVALPMGCTKAAASDLIDQAAFARALRDIQRSGRSI